MSSCLHYYGLLRYIQQVPCNAWEVGSFLLHMWIYLPWENFLIQTSLAYWTYILLAHYYVLLNRYLTANQISLPFPLFLWILVQHRKNNKNDLSLTQSQYSLPINYLNSYCVEFIWFFTVFSNNGSNMNDLILSERKSFIIVCRIIIEIIEKNCLVQKFWMH